MSIDIVTRDTKESLSAMGTNEIISKIFFEFQGQIKNAGALPTKEIYLSNYQPGYVYVFDALIIIGSGVHIEAEALFLQLVHGAFKIPGGHSDVTLRTQERRLHALKIRACKLGFLTVPGGKVEHHGKQLRKRRSGFRVGGVDANVYQFKCIFHSRILLFVW